MMLYEMQQQKLQLVLPLNVYLFDLFNTTAIKHPETL